MHWQSITWRRLWRRNLHRFSFVLSRLEGHSYERSRGLEELILSQDAPANIRRAVIIVSFHTDGMYGLLSLARNLNRPLVCLMTREAKRVLTLLRFRPHNVRFVSELSPADVGSIKRANEYLLVFADVNTSGAKKVHVPVFGKARVFSASWVSIVRSLGARAIAVTSVREGRIIRLDGLELNTEVAASRLVDCAFQYMQSRVSDPRRWDMIVSHDKYIDCPPVADTSGLHDRWRAMAACDLEVTRLVGRLAVARSGATKTQDTVHATEAEAVGVDPLQSR